MTANEIDRAQLPTVPVVTRTGGSDMAKTTCSVNGCNQPIRTRQWCNKHYQRWLKHGDTATVAKTPPGVVAEWLTEHIASTHDPVECVDWPFATNGAGYGRVAYKGRVKPVGHVVLYELVGRPPDTDMQSAHAPGVCHRPICVNPHHLRWATRKQNQADKLLDDTHQRGERQWQAKLAAHQVLRIYSDDISTQQSLADEFGVSPSTIQSIKDGRNWAWLTGHNNQENSNGN